MDENPCLWINDDYIKRLDIVINNFSLILDKTKNEDEHDKYVALCSESIRHKIALEQILAE